MKSLRSFGSPVVCGRCGGLFRHIYADSVEEASAGRGMCEECASKWAEVPRHVPLVEATLFTNQSLPESDNTISLDSGDPVGGLTRVHGIGDARAQDMVAHGVGSLAGLAGMSDEQIAVLAGEVEGVTEAQLLNWRDQARDLIDIETERELMRGTLYGVVEDVEG